MGVETANRALYHWTVIALISPRGIFRAISGSREKTLSDRRPFSPKNSPFLALLGLGLGAAAGAPQALSFQGGLNAMTFGGEGCPHNLPYCAGDQRLVLVVALGTSKLRAMRAGALAVHPQVPWVRQ